MYEGEMELCDGGQNCMGKWWNLGEISVILRDLNITKFIENEIYGKYGLRSSLGYPWELPWARATCYLTLIVVSSYGYNMNTNRIGKIGTLIFFIVIVKKHVDIHQAHSIIISFWINEHHPTPKLHKSNVCCLQKWAMEKLIKIEQGNRWR